MSWIKVIALASTIAFAPLASADQASFYNSGGFTKVTGGITVSSAVAAPSGSLLLNCPSTTQGSCAGGSLSFVSSDGSSFITASFSSGSYAEGCAGGGRGGHVTCSWGFGGYFTGTSTTNGVAQQITGVVAEYFGVNGAPAQGWTTWNSAYTPFYYTDSGQVVRSDDILGTNQITYGTYGDGVGQFYGTNGIALDSAGRIYIADSYNCRIVRIDDMVGTNWTSYGTCGTADGQFANPAGLAIDAAGRIYVMDSGNSRIVRVDDMTGTNFISYGTLGSDIGEFNSYGQSLSLDAAGRIYIADGGNKRVVRIDDMLGTNWIALTQSQPLSNGYSQTFRNPTAITLDAAGHIYIVDIQLVRVDDMTGANWISFNPGTTPNAIAVDSAGTVFTGGGIGGGVRLVENMATVLSSPANLSPYGEYYVFGIAPVPLPTPGPAALAVSPATLTFANQNTGTASPAQPVSIANFGRSPLNFASISASNGFVGTSSCPAMLVAGSNCTVQVAFAPNATGPLAGSLTLTDDSGNLGTAQVIALSGVGTAPVASAAPNSLTFAAQVPGTISPAQSVVLLNTGTGPMHVTNVTVTGPFTQTGNCTAAIAPGLGCTVMVSFKPAAVGPASGTLTFSGDAGVQSVSLTGMGSATVSTVTVSPAALLFAQQAIGTRSAVQTIVIANTGKTAAALKGFTVSGDFSQTSTCATTLAAGKSCVVTVAFTPTGAGVRSGMLSINLAAGTQTVQLTGTGATSGLPGALTVTPAALSFPNYTPGDNPSQTVTVSNPSGASVAIGQISLTGDSTFTQKNRCPSVLAAGASCTVTLTFRPVQYGNFTGSLTILESSGAQDIVPITGVGTYSN